MFARGLFVVMVAMLGAVLPADAASAPAPFITNLTPDQVSAYTGSTVPVTVYAKNDLDRSTVAVTAQFYLSATGTVSGARLISTGTFPSLAPKTSGSASMKVTVPPEISSGAYYLLVCLPRVDKPPFCYDKSVLKVYLAPAHLVFQPSGVTEFGSVTKGYTSAKKRLIVKNLGRRPSGGVAVGIAGTNANSFQIVSNGCTTSLAPGASCALDVAFRPTTTGPLKAVLTARPAATGATGGTHAVSGTGDSLEGSALPSAVLPLANWKLTLPVDSGGGVSGDAIEVKQPVLNSYHDYRYFHSTADNSGVAFRARVDGATTSGSSYPRSELREMTNNGADKADWSNESGTHTMVVDEAITHLPVDKPHVVAAQIHDDADDVLMIRLEGTKLFVESEGVPDAVLTSNYQLGTRFTIKLVAANSQVQIYYNNVLKATSSKHGNHWYFKAGCYTQSNTNYDDPGAYGEVVIYGLHVTHS